MLQVIEKIDPNKFTAIVTDGEAAMQAAKRRVIEKYPHIMAIRWLQKILFLLNGQKNT